MASMPEIPVPDVDEVQLTFKLGLIYFTNRFFFAWDPSVRPLGSATILAGVIGTWAINDFLPLLGSDVQLVHTRGRERDLGEGPWVTIPYTDYTGGASDVAMPVQVCCLIRTSAIRIAGERRGKVFVSGVPRDSIVFNEFESVFLSDLRNAFELIIEPPTTSGCQWVTVSFRTNNSWRSVGVVLGTGVLEPRVLVSTRRRRFRNLVLQP